MKLGAHLSISGGIHNAIKQAKKIGANTLQIFSGSPRGWETKDIEKLDTKKFKKFANNYKISPIFIHSKYLVNLASKNKKIQKKSINSLIADLKIAKAIGAQGVIFHPRVNKLVLLSENINQVLAKTPKSTFLILENSSRMSLAEIGKIIKMVKDKRLKFCLDLAHIFQFGYDLTNPRSLEKVFKIVKKEIGLNRWLVIHANDSKTKCGSGNDRHEDIAAGKIGSAPFSVFLNHPVSSWLPFILETPGFKEKGLEGDRRNLKMLKKLVGRKLNSRFFKQPTLRVARQLLGKYLVVKRKGRFQIGKIIETEAYIGTQDQANHASKGKTARTRIMWNNPGKLYVYLIYGMYYCLNIVTEKRGFPAAVLIRGLKPVYGISGKTDGPGKICRGLGITSQETGLDITKSQEIYINDIGQEPQKIIALPRIGVDYAGEWAKKKWRFVAKKYFSFSKN